MIPNDYKYYYDYFKEDSTCPRDVRAVVDQIVPGDEVEVYINSPGGVIDVGSEIYTMLRGCQGVKIYITGEACSAASIVAMAGHCEMSPTSLMMVHCVSSGVSGNHSDMEHMAEVLRTADRALCTAYTEKTGLTEAEVLEMMEKETWLTAEQALEKKLIDGIMFQEKENMPLVAGPLFALPTKEQMEKIKKMVKQEEDQSDSSCLLQAQMRFLNLKGEQR